MSGNPQISIIVPVFKAAGYLHQCIESIVKQSVLNFELLLIDDGSPDESGAICDEYSKKDARIKVFHKTNGGVSSARNFGLDNARGEWVCFVDSDDYLLSRALSIMIDKAIRYDADVTCFNNYFVDDNGKISSVIRTVGGDDKVDVEEDIKKRLRYLMLSQPWGKLYKKEILTGLKFDESIHIAEDLLFHITVVLSRSSIKVVNCQELFYYYRIWNGSAMAKASYNYELLYDKLKTVLTNVGVFYTFESEYKAFIIINIYNKVINSNNRGLNEKEYRQILPTIKNAYKLRKCLKFTNRIAILFYAVNRNIGNIYIRLFCFFKSAVNR